MPEIRWCCSTCSSSHATEEAATDCEKSHPALDAFRIKHIIYQNQDEQHGSARYSARVVPYKLRVECPSIYGHNHATYVLERIGCKGV